MTLVISKFRNLFYLAIRNDGNEEIDIDDAAHTGISSHAEILSRADTLRGATGWEIEDLTV